MNLLRDFIEWRREKRRAEEKRIAAEQAAQNRAIAEGCWEACKIAQRSPAHALIVVGVAALIGFQIGRNP